jgi:hypothetical protein
VKYGVFVAFPWKNKFLGGVFVLFSWCFRGFWQIGVVFEVFNWTVLRYFDGVWVCLGVFLSKIRVFWGYLSNEMRCF